MDVMGNKEYPVLLSSHYHVSYYSQIWTNIYSQSSGSPINPDVLLFAEYSIFWFLSEVKIVKNLFMVIIQFNYISHSAWFDSSRLGMMAAFVFWFLTYIPHLFLGHFYDSLPLLAQINQCY